MLDPLKSVLCVITIWFFYRSVKYLGTWRNKDNPFKSRAKVNSVLSWTPLSELPEKIICWCDPSIEILKWFLLLIKLFRDNKCTEFKTFNQYMYKTCTIHVQSSEHLINTCTIHVQSSEHLINSCTRHVQYMYKVQNI